MKKQFFYLLLSALPVCLAAQQSKIDSLRKSLSVAAADTNKVNALNALTKLYWQTGIYDSALRFGVQAKDLSEKLQFKKGVSAAFNNLGVTYWRQGNFPEALKNYYAALKISEELGDKRKMAAIYGNIGNIYIGQNELDQALKNELLSVQLATEKGDKKILSNSYNSVANIYYRKACQPVMDMRLRDSLLKLSVSNYLIAQKLNEETGNMINLAHNLNNLGLIYEMQARYFKRDKNKTAAQQKFEQARNMYLSGLKLEQETGDRDAEAGSYINLGNLHTATGQYALARHFLDSALAISKEIGNLDDLKDSYLYLHALDSALGNDEGAFRNYKNFVAVRDSLLNEENTRKSVQAQMNYEFEKKEAVARAEQERKDALAAADKRRQRIILISVSFFGLLVLGFAIFTWRSFLQKKRSNIEISRQKTLIEEKQKEILDSIHYARRIQRSLLPTEVYIIRTLNRLKKI